MGGAKWIVLALGALGEAGEAVALAERADAAAAPGQDLVRIGLVANVPHDAVMGRVEDIMQRERQLHDAEAGAEMPAGDRDRVDGLGAQFIGQLTKPFFGDGSQIVGGVDGIEEGRGDRHSCSL
jgi:hypothetical protein